MNDIADTLNERGKRYGDFDGHAFITQSLKDAMRATRGWEGLSLAQRESLEMIQHKIGRILNGDPNYADSWHDIAGYAKLVEDLLTRNSSQTNAAIALESGNNLLTRDSSQTKQPVKYMWD